MNWKFVDKRGKMSKVNTQYQMDEVGNVLQIGGAVKPKACQKCKKKFNAKTKDIPQTAKVPWFKCSQEDFEAPTMESVYFHIQDNGNTHEIVKTHKEKIVGVESQSVGRLAIITQFDTECIILCSDCDGSKS